MAIGHWNNNAGGKRLKKIKNNPTNTFFLFLLKWNIPLKKILVSVINRAGLNEL